MPLTSPPHLVLAGGGHSHALVLLQWCMHPQRRPAGLITLVNQQSSTLYSGMIPGLIAGHYERSEIAIDLRRLCDRAGVALVIAEITGVDVSQQQLQLHMAWTKKAKRIYSFSILEVEHSTYPYSP